MSDQPSPLRLRFETVGSITAIVVGVAALWVSWDQGRVMRQEMRASAWPALQIDIFNDTSGGGLAAGLSIENAGVGPALIERVTLMRGDVLIEDLDQLRAIVGGDGELPNTSNQTAQGRILAAGNAFRPFEFHFEDVTDFRLASEFNFNSAELRTASPWTLEVCYCSSLGDCWVTGTDINPPAEIDRCDAKPSSDL